jgi:hypothetical protein
MEQEKIFEILTNYKTVSNKELLEVLKFLDEDFYKTKDLILKLTRHLDTTEISYNKILEEFNRRTNNVN